MNRAAMILGILGGGISVLAALFGLVAASSMFLVIGEGLSGDGLPLLLRTLGAMMLGMLGIFGGVLATRQPRFAGWLMVLAAAAGIVGLSVFNVFASALMLAGGVLALRTGNAAVAQRGPTGPRESGTSDS